MEERPQETVYEEIPAQAYRAPAPSYAVAESSAEPVTVKQWLLFWLVGLVNMIPVIGTIVYLIIIGLIAFSNVFKVPPSMKSFCKSYLVLLAVGIVLFLAFAGSFMGMLFSAGSFY